MHVDVVWATGLQSSSLSVQLLVLVFRVGGEHLGPFRCRASTPFAGSIDGTCTKSLSRVGSARGCSKVARDQREDRLCLLVVHADLLAMSQPELGANQIVRFVTKQAPAPQAPLKFGRGAREEGEEGRVLY